MIEDVKGVEPEPEPEPEAAPESESEARVNGTGGDGEDEDEIGPGEHRLQHPYWLWYRSPAQVGGGGGAHNYERSLEMVGRCASVEQWWALYSHLKRVDELPADSSFHLFKAGVRPMWEDRANVDGGKWEVRVRRATGAWAWEELCIAMIGERFEAGDEICGAVVNVRAHEVALAVWHRTADDRRTAQDIQETIKRALELPPWTQLEYKRHSRSLRAATLSAAQPPPPPPPPPDS